MLHCFILNRLFSMIVSKTFLKRFFNLSNTIIQSKQSSSASDDKLLPDLTLYLVKKEDSSVVYMSKELSENGRYATSTNNYTVTHSYTYLHIVTHSYTHSYTQFIVTHSS